MSRAELYHGDCLDVLRTLPAASVDAVVTDPPAGIAFMGQAWDRFGGRSNADAARDRDAADRGPGAGLGSQPFGYSGSSMPRTPAERGRFVDFLAPRLAEARRVSKPGSYMLCWALPRTSHWTGVAVEDAGWVIRDRVSHLFGTGFPKSKACLKPGMEDWWLAWNPAKRVTPLNIDKCRVSSSEPTARSVKAGGGNLEYWRTGKSDCTTGGHPSGRWPANVTHDGSPEVLEAFAVSGDRKSGGRRALNGEPNTNMRGDGFIRRTEHDRAGDSGSAARFFYCSKASGSDRGEGNTHPTVKSTELMRWLCRLVTPGGGVVLDPFMGSGSTATAAALEGFGFVGVEQSGEYLEIARRRIDAALALTTTEALAC